MCQVPRLNSTERAALLNYGGGLKEYRCASDADCAGLPWDPVVGGVCGADGRCVCPLPRSGSACQRDLSCRWLDDEASTWRGGGCALHEGESSAERVACACDRLRGSVAVMHRDSSSAPPFLFSLSPPNPLPSASPFPPSGDAQC